MIKQEHWIVDSGATDHIPFSLNSFTYAKLVRNYYVHKPNNKRIHVSLIRTVKLSPTLVLHDVLCVPSFKFNLMSIRQITKDRKTCVFFTDRCCVVKTFLHGG